MLWRQSDYPGEVVGQINWCLEGLALLAFMAGDTEWVATLLGIAWEQGREGPGEHHPDFPSDYAPTLRQRYAVMRDGLPVDVTPCWHQGRELGKADAVRFALEEI